MDKHYKSKIVEVKWREKWAEAGIYRFKGTDHKPIYSIDTPPPYVSAFHLHIGHAMSYIQAEIITRFRRMQGYNVFYPMGFDDNGLPTERYVENKYGVSKSEVSRQRFTELCLKETAIGIAEYKKMWQKLAIGVDWSLSYSTIGPRAQRIAQISFLDLYHRGLVYRESAPVFWCTTCGTALAQADLENQHVKGKLYFLSFQVQPGQKLVIATTRPEMLPACVALYVHPDDGRYQHLIGTKARIPIFHYEVDILSHLDVDPNFGTGIMMVCTWGDSQDVKKWKEDQLETRTLIDQHGLLTEVAGKYQGLTLTQAKQEIVKALREGNLIEREDTLEQTVNHHERCGTPVEFSFSPQWFIKILAYKDELLTRGDELEWYPPFMKTRYRDWVEGLKWDWCISRDRFYGVPFPVWYCQNCNHVVTPSENQLPVDPRDGQPNNLNCPKCQGDQFQAEEQVMDTWMTSSLTPLINAHWREDNELVREIYPMDLRVQGFEIIRTWLFYTVIKSMFHTQTLPWRSVMISGWGLDDAGKKMSKSKGNFVAVEEVIEKYSADAIRWWSTGASLGHDLRYREEELQSAKKIVDKLWNAGRFIAKVLEQSRSKDINIPQPTFADRWIMAELQELISRTTETLSVCDFSQARIALDKFFWSLYCDTYLEFCKDRTWHPEKYSLGQIASLVATLSSSFNELLKLLAPFLPYVTEELYHLLFEKDEDKSIHLADWPTVNQLWQNKAILKRREALLEIINRIRYYKSQVIGSHRAEIKSISLLTMDEILLEAISDLAGLAKAKNFSVNNGEGRGDEYQIKSSPQTKIIFSN